jgi:transducin (beta)-like 1
LSCLDWNFDGTLLAIGSSDSILRVIDRNGQLYFLHTQHLVRLPIPFTHQDVSCGAKDVITAIQFSISGQWLLTASFDGTTCVWDMKNKKLHMQYWCHKGGWIYIIFDSYAEVIIPDSALDIDWLDDSTFACCARDTLIDIVCLGENVPIKTLS